MADPKSLPPALKQLVHDVEAALGRAVADLAGPAAYRDVEDVRRLMAAFRDAPARRKPAALDRACRRVARIPESRRPAFAHAYTLYLELVNACENAYREHRLRRRGAEAEGPRARLTMVLTSHPTESRDTENVRLLRRVQRTLAQGLDAGRTDARDVEPWIRLLWKLKTHRARRPRLEDEAAHVYSLLDDSVLGELIALRAAGHVVKLRSWVGGDKDGHPGVGPAQALASLALSRRRLAVFAARRLQAAERDAAALGEPALSRAVAAARATLSSLGPPRAGDGARAAAADAALRQAARLYRRALGSGHPALEAAAGLADMFPGLVIPLEVRERAGAFGARDPIAALMRAVADAARGGDCRWYVQGCVVSMAETEGDVLEALERCDAIFGAGALPVIPLFESPESLRDAGSIVERCWASPAFRRAARRRRGVVEIMLGYSDSAKRVGALASRLAIRQAMSDLSRWAQYRRVSLVFFHGAGGSEGRGGGTIAERAATWPPGSLALFKETVQGEMIERALAAPEIIRRHVAQVARVQAAPPAASRVDPFTARLGRLAAAEFASLTRDPLFGAMLEAATPYRRLAALHLGSRPAARPDLAGPPVDQLRAIPWVLCWTQTRLLLPVWYGVGHAWIALRSQAGRAALRRALLRDPLLRAYLRQLGFALVKAEPLIWERYARRAPARCAPVLARIRRDWDGCRHLVGAADPRGPLWDRLWLRESVFYRAPMIHPLNLLQIELLGRRRLDARGEALLRETVTGIASGMLTTG